MPGAGGERSLLRRSQWDRAPAGITCRLPAEKRGRTGVLRRRDVGIRKANGHGDSQAVGARNCHPITAPGCLAARLARPTANDRAPATFDPRGLWLFLGLAARDRSAAFGKTDPHDPANGSTRSPLLASCQDCGSPASAEAVGFCVTLRASGRTALRRGKKKALTALGNSVRPVISVLNKTLGSS